MLGITTRPGTGPIRYGIDIGQLLEIFCVLGHSEFRVKQTFLESKPVRVGPGCVAGPGRVMGVIRILTSTAQTFPSHSRQNIEAEIAVAGL